MLIASTSPFFILFHHGYLRRSLVDFNMGKKKLIMPLINKIENVEDNKNRYVHLTNASI